MLRVKGVEEHPLHAELGNYYHIKLEVSPDNVKPPVGLGQGRAAASKEDEMLAEWG